MNKLSAVAQALGGVPGAAILALSALVAAGIAKFGGFIFFIDSVDFFNYAARLLHLRIDTYYYSIGYPLLILFTGFTHTGSLVPLLVTQAAFAALMPWLAFKTFEPSDRRAAIAAGVVCIASLTPFFFENTFFHDQTALFFGFLSITFASIFFHSRLSRYIHLSAASATWAYLAQPGVIGFFVGCVGAFALFALRDRKQVRHVAVVIGIFVVTVVSVSAFEKSAMRRDHLVQPPSQLGRRIFFNEYLLGTPHEKLTGPAADDLRRALVAFFAHPPSFVDTYVESKLGSHGEEYQDVFGQYQGHADQLVDRMFTRPSRHYFEIMWNLPDFSNAVPDRLFLRASLAYLYQHPLIAAGYIWRNVVDFTIGLPWSCQGDDVFPACRTPQWTYFLPSMANQVTLAPGRMPDNAYRFLTGRRTSEGWLMRTASVAWQVIYRDLRIPLLVVMFLGWIAAIWLSSELRWTIGAFGGAYVVNLIVFSFFEQPEFRYQLVGMSMSAFAAGPSLYFVLSPRFTYIDRFRKQFGNREAAAIFSHWIIRRS